MKHFIFSSEKSKNSVSYREHIKRALLFILQAVPKHFEGKPLERKHAGSCDVTNKRRFENDVVAIRVEMTSQSQEPPSENYANPQGTII